MTWTLSEFLNHVELRSQTWCFATLGEGGGFSVPHSQCMLFYALLEGKARLAGIAGKVVELEAGDIVLLMSGEAHAVRLEAGASAPTFPFIADGDYGDAPASFVFGEGRTGAHLLCGKLKVRWPGGQQPRSLPSLLHCGQRGLVDFRALVDAARGAGSSAVLTHLANLLFVENFRQSPECQAVFRDSSLHDPIARALHYIEKHPFTDWSVEMLARKVGMGRANFAARFVAAVGRTPFETLTAERMRHAAEMLAGTDLKIAEIAERVGYRSEAAFSRRFTAHFGHSPGALRRRQREAGRLALVQGAKAA